MHLPPSSAGSIASQLNFAIAHVAAERHALAIEPLRAILKKEKFHPAATHYLGVALCMSGSVDEGFLALDRSLKLDPTNATFHSNAAEARRRCGDYEHAIRDARRALELQPNHPDAGTALGRALMDTGRLDEARVAFEQTLAKHPKNHVAWFNLGNTLGMLKRVDECAQCHGIARNLFPPLRGMSLAAVANFLSHAGRYEEAVALCWQALSLEPNQLAALNNLGSAQMNLLQLDAAIANFRKALTINPDYTPAQNNLLMCLTYLPGADRGAVVNEFRAWGSRFSSRFPDDFDAVSVDRSPERRLRVGYISSDFREHPVAYFIEPLLRGHDAQEVEIFAYDLHGVPDRFTERIRTHTHHWRTLVGLNLDAMVKVIRADKLDLLLDLNGHTAGGRLEVFARRCAPVQVSYLGDQNTTGLATVDYRITDVVVDASDADAFYTEKLVRLPRIFAAYEPIAESPAVSELPALASGQITFASFAKVLKVNDMILGLWARVLKGVPGSILRLSALGWDQREVMDRVKELFGREGVDSSRVRVSGNVGLIEYLKSHDEIDVILDSYPFAGHTTTMHALWMGVPTLTLAGNTYASRMGKAVMEAVSLPEFVAASGDEFVEKAIAWSGQLEKLSEIRRGLRDRVSSSSLVDGRGLAQSIEKAYRQMWKRYCAGESPQAFAVDIVDRK